MRLDVIDDDIIYGIHLLDNMFKVNGDVQCIVWWTNQKKNEKNEHENFPIESSHWERLRQLWSHVVGYKVEWLSELPGSDRNPTLEGFVRLCPWSVVKNVLDHTFNVWTPWRGHYDARTHQWENPCANQELNLGPSFVKTNECDTITPPARYDTHE